jgi:hypothetical protein
MAAPKAQKSREVKDVLKAADEALARKRAVEQTAEPAEQAVEERFEKIEANPFYRIMFEEGVSPEKKMEAIARELSFALESPQRENKARLEEYARFKEYLQHERKQMALEVIRLTDTGAFGELQQVLTDLNTAVLAFNDRMAPLTEIIDAVYDLRVSGNTLNVFREIQQDKDAEVERARRLADKEAEIARLTGLVRTIERDIAAQAENKSLLRFVGGNELTKEARRAIAMLRVDLDEVAQLTRKYEDDIVMIRNESSGESKFAQYAAQKAKLRELLDLTSAEHKERQEALVRTAHDFVISTSTRVGNVLGHLEGMSRQADALYENNGHIRHAYAILGDAEKSAGNENQRLRETLQVVAPGESGIQEMERTSKLEAVEDFIARVNLAAVDTTQTGKDLIEQGGNIKTMRDTNRQQIDKTRKLHSSSVSGVSERLATVLQAVSAAALNEASAGAKDSIQAMADNTRRILGQKAIENAVGMQETVADLDRALEDLKTFGELQDRATELTRSTLREIGEKMGVLEKTTQEVAEGLRESISVHASAEIHQRGQATAPGDPAAPEADAPKRRTRAPFGSLAG